MSIIEVHLFEMALKGDQLDDINAEEALNRRAVAQAKARARWLSARRLGQQLYAWLTAHRHVGRALSRASAK